MKRTFVLLVTTALISAMLIGCSASSPAASQKSEEELKAEIKAELEAEEKKKAELEAEIRAEIEAEQGVNETQQKPEETNTQPQPTQSSKAPEEPVKEQNDISKGYTFKVEGGNLKITYTNTGNSEIIIKANKTYSVIKEDSSGVFELQRQFSVLSAEKDGNKLYFKVIDPESGWEVTYYIDVNTRKIYWVNPDQNAGSEISSTEESEFLKLSGFKPEIINGERVEFGDYTTVIAPMYDGINSTSLHSVRQVIGSVTQENLSLKVNFAVFGHMKNIQITYFAGMDAAGELLDVGDLYNSNVVVEIWLPGGDGAYVRVQGYASSESEEYNAAVLTLDDMKTDYEVLKY